MTPPPDDHPAAERNSQNFVNGFARGLAVIEAFADAPDALSLAEVAARAGLDRAVTRRMLLTLVELGFVIQTNRRFRLAPRILRLGYAFLSQASFDGMLRPFLMELTQKLEESVSVSVLDGTETVIVCHVTATMRKAGLLMREGSRWPAYATASGRVLLSPLSDEDIRHRLGSGLRPLTRRTLTDPEAILRAIRTAEASGYALLDEELEDGLASASVPIFDRRGKLVASLNASSAKVRRSPHNLRTAVVPLLQQVSAEVGKLIPDGMLAG